MITEMEMYWLTRLDYICEFAKAGIFLSILGIFVLTVFSMLEDKEAVGKRYLRKLWIPSVFLLFFAFMRVFTPTTKEYAAIRVIPMVANNKDVQKLGSNIVDLANKWMEDAMTKKETKPE